MPTATASYRVFHLWQRIAPNTRAYRGEFWATTPYQAAKLARTRHGAGVYSVRERKHGGIILAAA